MKRSDPKEDCNQKLRDPRPRRILDTNRLRDVQCRSLSMAPGVLDLPSRHKVSMKKKSRELGGKTCLYTQRPSISLMRLCRVCIMFAYTSRVRVFWRVGWFDFRTLTFSALYSRLHQGINIFLVSFLTTIISRAVILRLKASR
jgi:hypothetical protein